MIEKQIKSIITRDYYIIVAILVIIILFLLFLSKQSALDTINNKNKQLNDKLLECTELLQQQQKIIRENQDVIKLKSLIETKKTLEQELIDNNQLIEETKNLLNY